MQETKSARSCQKHDTLHTAVAWQCLCAPPPRSPETDFWTPPKHQRLNSCGEKPGKTALCENCLVFSIFLFCFVVVVPFGWLRRWAPKSFGKKKTCRRSSRISSGRMFTCPYISQVPVASQHRQRAIDWIGPTDLEPSLLTKLP